MSHHSVNYAHHADESAKRAAAMQDIRDWLGVERFNILADEFAKLHAIGELQLDQFRLWLSFAGIQGYPVAIWFEQITGEEMPEDTE